MGEVRKILISNKSIYVIDYGGCKEDEMIALAGKLAALLQEENTPQRILVCHANSYVTSRYMRFTENESSKNIHLIGKMAFLGLDDTKKIILKGYNLFMKRDYQAFESEADAIAYLTAD